MTMKILVPLDGSAQSEVVFPTLRQMARRTQITVHLLRCYESPATMYVVPTLALPAMDELADKSLRAAMTEYLGEKERELSALEISTEAVRGDAASEISGRAKDHDLVIMASHGRGGLERWMIGSTTTKVVRTSRKPVLVIGGSGLKEPRLETIMVAVDGSPHAERAFKKAKELALRLDAKLLLYRAVAQVSSETENAEALTEAQAYVGELVRECPGMNVVTEVLSTASGHSIQEVAKKYRADLVALGSHGRRGLIRWLMGSVAEEVLHQPPCSVMIVH